MQFRFRILLQLKMYIVMCSYLDQLDQTSPGSDDRGLHHLQQIFSCIVMITLYLNKTESVLAPFLILNSKPRKATP